MSIQLLQHPPTASTDERSTHRRRGTGAPPWRHLFRDRVASQPQGEAFRFGPTVGRLWVVGDVDAGERARLPPRRRA